MVSSLIRRWKYNSFSCNFTNPFQIFIDLARSALAGRVKRPPSETSQTQATIESALRPAVKQTFVGILTPWFGVAINETYLITSIVNIVDQAVPQLRSY